MNEESHISIWDWIKGIFLIIVSFSGTYEIASLIFPFNNGYWGYLLWFILLVAFLRMVLKPEPGRDLRSEMLDE